MINSKIRTLSFVLCALYLDRPTGSRAPGHIQVQNTKYKEQFILSKDPVYFFSSFLPQLRVATWRSLHDVPSAKLRAPSYFQIPAVACNAENPANRRRMIPW